LRAQQVSEKERPLFRMPQQFCVLQNHLLFSNNNNKLKGFYAVLALWQSRNTMLHGLT